MDINLPSIAAIALVICLATILQSAVGFGSGLFAIPLLIWIGLPLPKAITVACVCSFLLSAVGAAHLRSAVPWRAAAAATAVRLAALSAGLFILWKLMALSVSDIKLVVGAILCVLVTVHLTVRARPRAAVHWLWGALAFSTSGLLLGICGMGGPPLVLWTLAHDWPAEKTRGFLFAVFGTSVPIQLILLYTMFGVDILRAAGIAALLVPAILLGVAIGLPLGNRIPKRVLRVIAYVILFVIGLNSVLQPLVHRLR